MITFRYEAKVIQQPKHARVCGFGRKVDRRPIDPPPILQFFAKKKDSDDFIRPTEIPCSIFAYAVMVTEKNPLKEAHFLDDLKRTRLVLGSITSSIHLLNGPDGKEGMFFAFPDISIRIEGIFRIKFLIYDITPKGAVFLTSSMSERFTVHSAKFFTGMQESTILSRTFADQGIKIRIRSGIRSGIRTTPKAIVNDSLEICVEVSKKRKGQQDDSGDQEIVPTKPEIRPDRLQIYPLCPHSRHIYPPFRSAPPPHLYHPSSLHLYQYYPTGAIPSTGPYPSYSHQYTTHISAYPSYMPPLLQLPDCHARRLSRPRLGLSDNQRAAESVYHLPPMRYGFAGSPPQEYPYYAPHSPHPYPYPALPPSDIRPITDDRLSGNGEMSSSRPTFTTSRSDSTSDR